MQNKLRMQIPLQSNATIFDAISHIQGNEERICIVVDSEGTLYGTITDGDIRRALLRGASLEDSLSLAANTSPVKINQIDANLGFVPSLAEVTYVVVVDENNLPLGLVQTSELRRTKDIAVVLMAGGRGTRLLPLTAATPKPLIEIGDKAIIEILISRLAEQGFRQFIISIRHLGEMIESRLGDGSQLGVRIDYVREDYPLGTAGALALVRGKVGSNFFVANADVVTTCDFTAMANFHSESKALATVGIREYFHQIPFGVIKTNNSEITGLEEKPLVREYVAAGIYCFNSQILDLVSDSDYLDMPDLLNNIIQKRKKTVVGFPIHESWDDVGQIADLERVRKRLEKG
jgi:dTDP-glucose pyrophosphorylase